MTDGPYAETKEQLGGILVLEARDLNHAIQLISQNVEVVEKVRPVDYIVDFKGEGSGFATTMACWTAGVTHRFNALFSVRPEVRYEHAFRARPWDNGQRKDQFIFAIDALLRF